MKVSVSYGNNTCEYFNQPTISIGCEGSDFVIAELGDNFLKLVYSSKYNNYVLVNSKESKDILYNGKTFSKVLVNNIFTITSSLIEMPIAIEVNTHSKEEAEEKSMENIRNVRATEVANAKDVFNCSIEKNRIAIIKEIGYKILELKNNIKSAGITAFVLNIAMIILSVVSSFGITNFLLGFKIDKTSSVLNLTTNFGFLVCITAIVLAVCMILKWGVYSLLEFNKTKRLGESNIPQKFIIGISSIFMFIVYVMNLFYYKSIPGFTAAALFVSLLFVGALATVTVAGGYFKSQIKNDRQKLQNCEYREDFENVMKDYRSLVYKYVNSLSNNRINTVKNNLVNAQLKMIVEVFVGLLTAPFLAYGVSNTLAGCFPEAANWVRISGLRFSPIFLVLATFLIIFAFFSYVRAFTIGKQIKGSEIIKFDGFHDYSSHGVTVLGLDSMRSLEREKNVVMFIACFIILIEFTMNVSYFITELGGGIQETFLSFVTALVPTALLIAETHLLSSTMYKIHNCEDLLATLD